MNRMAILGSAPLASEAAGSPARRSRGARARERGATRAALVRCGVELCTERGFQVTGIDEILRRVGVPKGSFYHFFPSKKAFGVAVIDNYAQYFGQKLGRHLQDDSLAPLQRLRNFIEEACEGMARYAFRRGCLVGNMGQELGGLDDDFQLRLEAVLRAWQSQTAACLELARDAGEIPASADPAALAEVFWIGWEGAILRSKLHRSAQPMQAFSEFFFVHISR